jgi:hypothetical protein
MEAAIAGRRVLGVAFACVAVSSVVTAWNVVTTMVEPQSIELRLMRRQVAAVPPGATHIGFVMLNWFQGPTGRYYSDELGVASAARPWTPEPAVTLILREEGRLAPDAPRPRIDVLPWQTTNLPEGLPIVNLRELEPIR